MTTRVPGLGRTSLTLLGLATLLTACAEPLRPYAESLTRADAALAAKKYADAAKGYQDVLAESGAYPEGRYAAQVGITKVDAATTRGRADTLAHDGREPRVVLADILEARRTLRLHGSDPALDGPLVEAENAQIRAELANVKEALVRGETMKVLETLAWLERVPGISSENLAEIGAYRATTAARYRESAKEAKAASAPFAARIAMGLAAAFDRMPLPADWSLASSLRPKVVIASLRMNGSLCEASRKEVERLVSFPEGGKLATVELDVSECTSTTRDETTKEQVTYVTTTPVTRTIEVTERECETVAASSGLHTYCSGVYHKPGTSGYSNPNCDVRLVTVPQHTECAMVKRSREVTTVEERRHTASRTKTTRQVAQSAKGTLRVTVDGVVSGHDFLVRLFAEDDAYPVVGTLRGKEFGYPVSDVWLKQNLGGRIASEVSAELSKRFANSHSDLPARLAEARSKGTWLEADDLAGQSLLARKGGAEHIQERFGVPEPFARALFEADPRVAVEGPPSLPEFAKLELTEADRAFMHRRDNPTLDLPNAQIEAFNWALDLGYQRFDALAEGAGTAGALGLGVRAGLPVAARLRTSSLGLGYFDDLGVHATLGFAGGDASTSALGFSYDLSYTGAFGYRTATWGAFGGLRPALVGVSIDPFGGMATTAPFYGRVELVVDETNVQTSLFAFSPIGESHTGLELLVGSGKEGGYFTGRFERVGLDGGAWWNSGSIAVGLVK